MDGDKFDMLVNKARALVALKGEDYNSGVDLHDYFPFGDSSYIQMLHMKTTRLVSLVQQNKEANFESVEDTVLDLINYAVFYLDYLESTEK